jgi:hypothetical protein
VAGQVDVTAHCRIGRVRLKSGADLRVLRTMASDHHVGFKRRACQVLDYAGSACVGYAVVAWARDGKSWCDIQAADGSRIPCALVPDFVRNRLLAEKIEEWTLETLGSR